MVKRTEYSLLPAQGKFLFDTIDERLKNEGEEFLDVSCYQGGFGSGKTFCGSLRGLLYALTWDGCKGLVGAISQDLLDGTTKVKYIEHLENMGMKQDEHWWLIEKGNTIKLKNGSTIKFKTLSDWHQFRSYEFTWIEIEEASLVQERAFLELIARVREQKKSHWKNYFRSIFLHTNPGGARGWIYKYFTNKDTKIDDYRIIIAATRENKHLGQSYEETLRKLYGADDTTELLMGVDVDNDNAVAFPLFTAMNTVDEIAFNPDYPLILSCDFNYNPMCWYIMQEVNGVWYVLEELIHSNVTTRQMCDKILANIEQYGVRKFLIMGDAHGRDKKTNGSDYGIMLPFFSSRGFDVTLRVGKYNPLIKERLALLRGAICNGLMERRLFVAKSCTRLLYNFDQCRINLANGGLKAPTDKEIQDDINKLYLIHPIDAISYPIWFTQAMKDIE
ncbi:MAG: phage terminase large subunit [Acetobacter sp.]|nr:phage terminase large subunit [Acetobacter sp.]